MRKLDDVVFPNIKLSYLHMVAINTLMFTCIELLQWIINHTETKKCMINNDNGECVRVFLPMEVQNYYKFRDPKERLKIASWW